ncbi:MAG: hypothetical protein ACKVJ6_06465 [Flavobacteriales bacterium]
MRLTNYFIHPADNRYYVFSFSKEDHSDVFRESLTEMSIPFEFNEDNEMVYGAKYLYGVPRTHFNQALKQNHLLYADIRSPLIPNKFFKWALLLITGGAILLGVLGAMSSNVNAQGMPGKSVWELSVLARVNTPFEVVGVEEVGFDELGLNTVWSPKVGQELGMRLQYRLKENWSFGSGIHWVRRNYSIRFNYVNDSLSINDFDTIPQLGSVGYRIPFFAATRIPLGLGYYVSATAGIGIDLKPSDSFVSTDNYEAYLGRVRWASSPIIAEIGIYKEPKGEVPGFYIGAYWSRSVGKSIWVEQVVQFQSDYRIVSRGYLASTLAGIEIRVLLE